MSYLAIDIMLQDPTSLLQRPLQELISPPCKIPIKEKATGII